jgi:DNA-binding transcriptional MerR regulator
MNLSTDNAQDFLKSLGIGEQKLNEFLPKAISPLVLPSDIGISARVFHYWREKGLLKDHPITDKRSEWVKLNLLEVTWLKIVQQLLQFGFKMSDIKEIGDNLNRDFRDVLKDIDLIPEIKKLKYSKEVKDFYIELLPVLKNNPELINVDILKIYTTLGSIISDILLYNGNVKLIVYHENKKMRVAIEGLKHSEPSDELLKRLTTMTRLIIPISDLIAEFLCEEKNQKHMVEFGLLTNEEVAAIEAIRNNDVREISIKKDHEDKITLTTSKHGKLNEEDIKKLIKIFGLNEYNEVRLVLRNKKDIFLEGKSKYKL